jgi:hypothetical protein
MADAFFCKKHFEKQKIIIIFAVTKISLGLGSVKFLSLFFLKE